MNISQIEREQIKGMLAAGSDKAIDLLIEGGLYRRKIHKVDSVDRDARQITFVVTRESVDRDGELVKAASLREDIEHYEANPVVLFNHNRAIPAVGRMVHWEEKGAEVVMQDVFAPDVHEIAKVLWELYSADPPFMRMVSLGFIPIGASNALQDKHEGQTGLTFTRVEVTEHSLVNVGANRHALSKMPGTIRNDSALKKVYEAMVEAPPEAAIGATVFSTGNTHTINKAGATPTGDTAPEEEIPQMQDKAQGNPDTPEHAGIIKDGAAGQHTKELAKAAAREKVYSMRGKIKGTYEQRISIIAGALEGYVNDNFDADPRYKDYGYEYVDYSVLGTEPDKVLFYIWHTSKCYSVKYTVDDMNEVEFNDLMQVEFDYTEMPVDEDDE